MAVRGLEEKQEIINKIKEIYPSSFEHNKELRIPINGLEIKLSLTCAKETISPKSAIDITEIDKILEKLDV